MAATRWTLSVYNRLFFVCFLFKHKFWRETTFTGYLKEAPAQMWTVNTYCTHARTHGHIHMYCCIDVVGCVCVCWVGVRVWACVCPVYRLSVCLPVCLFVCLNIYIYIYIYIYHLCMYACICVCVERERVNAYARTYPDTHIHTPTHTRAHTHGGHNDICFDSHNDVKCHVTSSEQYL